jgi:hypothetical protein
VRQEPDPVLANKLAALVSRPMILEALFGGQPRLPNVDARQIWITVWIRGGELRLAKNRAVELNNVDNVVKIRHHPESRKSWSGCIYVDPTGSPTCWSSRVSPDGDDFQLIPVFRRHHRSLFSSSLSSICLALALSGFKSNDFL